MVLSGSGDNDLALSEDFILKRISWLLVQGLLVRGGTDLASALAL